MSTSELVQTGSGVEAAAPAAARASSRSELIAFGVMVALLVAAPFLFYPVSVMKALCFALFACAFNLLVGYVGLLSFGHALFFGWASYVTAHVAKIGLSVNGIPIRLGQFVDVTIPIHFTLPPFPPEWAILTGTVFAAFLGYVAGKLSIRRQGIYFAMITLALAQMMFFFALQAPFTGGEDGIQQVPRGRLFGTFSLADQMTMYFTVLTIFLVSFAFIYRVINSPFGEVLKAIRENEPRAISLGYKTERYKLVAFVLSATLSGLAGGTKAIVFQLASLTDVDWTMSGEVVLMTLVGGLGTVFGPVVGAFVIIAMQDELARYGQWVTVIQGIIFVLCVLLFRRGIVGEIANYFRIRL